MTNIIFSKAPLSMEDLRDLFMDNSKMAYIDYETSDLKGKQFLIYLANTGSVPMDIIVKPSLPKEERFSLLVDYMNHQSLINCNTLNTMVAAILTATKGIDSFYEMLVNPFLTKEEIIEFINENKTLVSKWAIVMDSIVLAVMAASKRYVEAFGHPSEETRIIDDEQIIGLNFVQLLKLEYFVELYYSIPGETLIYFSHLFDEPIFNHNALFYYIVNSELFNILKMLEDGQGFDLSVLHAFLDQVEEGFANG